MSNRTDSAVRQAQFNSLRDEVNRLDHVNQLFKSEVRQLKSDKAGLESQNTRLRSLNNTLLETNSRLQRDLQQAQKRKEELKREISRLQSQLPEEIRAAEVRGAQKTQMNANYAISQKRKKEKECRELRDENERLKAMIKEGKERCERKEKAAEQKIKELEDRLSRFTIPTEWDSMYRNGRHRSDQTTRNRA
ncbi:hypothetical protein QBC38DRAFT_447414 [Podospora fimiseda]|uniref:Uncharacterized protein n=1 Tax=Podospora fimiseda TaxID=252190 RepID=A0AAN7BHE9_9PEZI|nr:hypothetical protein QBC38DRAFT_447414 [Podospora fimiseda]